MITFSRTTDEWYLELSSRLPVHRRPSSTQLTWEKLQHVKTLLQRIFVPPRGMYTRVKYHCCGRAVENTADYADKTTTLESHP